MKLASLAAVVVLGASAMNPTPLPQEAALPKRVQELERWKAAAEARITALEELFKAEGKPSASAPADAAERVLTIVVTNKRLDPSDPMGGKYEDNIWWDVEYTAAGLQKPARSIKGVLKFCDLFGDPRFQVRLTIDDPIKPNGKLSVAGVGVEYNQFRDEHEWLLATELSNMTFRFQVETVLYEDGTTERFGP